MVGDYMNSTELILKMQELYDSRTREEILTNLNIAISLGKLKGLAVDRYEALPRVTGKSKHTVMSWFNRENVKIPLISLCILAHYTGYNIFSFLKIKENCEMTIGDFLIENELCNYPPDSAKFYIKAYDLQAEVDKETVLNNIEKYYGTTEKIMAHHSNERQNKIMKICDCKQQTYYAWFNRSRKNVKIPLIPLCKLAYEAGIDVFDLFRE